MQSEYKILDCTLRDGGYYNDWNFDSHLVTAYLNAMSESGVDMVELGLRNFSGSGFKGPFYFTTDDFLSSLNLDHSIQYGVMINASTVINFDGEVEDAITRLFVPSKNSKISFVRIAAHVNELVECPDIISILSTLGYDIYLNIMQIGLHSEDEIKNALWNFAPLKDLRGVYFADSLGSMLPEDIGSTLNTISASLNHDIGIHAHNNMGLALSNSLKALDLGAKLIDVTVSGMGRGAGNAETETLLAHLIAEGSAKYNLKPVIELALRFFYPMKAKFGWGTNCYYYLAAKFNTHPTFVQRILTSPHFDIGEKVAASDVIPRLKGQNSFCPSILASKFNHLEDESRNDLRHLGTNTLSGLKKGNSSTAILVGSGASSELHSFAIKAQKKRLCCNVFAVNEGSSSLAGTIDTHIISQNIRQIDSTRISGSTDVSIIKPYGATDQLHKNEPITTFNYALKVSPGEFKATPSIAVIPFDLTAAYALAVLKFLGYSQIYIVGFDGYGKNDRRQKQMTELFAMVQKNYPGLLITALTPTTYPVRQASAYAPSL
jgi:4-hydroxy 2-oxovalerate aldolase